MVGFPRLRALVLQAEVEENSLGDLCLYELYCLVGEGGKSRMAWPFLHYDVPRP